MTPQSIVALKTSGFGMTIIACVLVVSDHARTLYFPGVLTAACIMLFAWQEARFEMLDLEAKSMRQRLRAHDEIMAAMRTKEGGTK